MATEIAKPAPIQNLHSTNATFDLLKAGVSSTAQGVVSPSPTKSVFDFLLDNEVPILRGTVAARDRASRMSSSFLNRDRGDGRTVPYVVMAFLDGSFPDHDPHNLPALLNVDNIDDLTDDEVEAYVAGYGLSQQHGRDAIKAYIGCTC
ncbi:hypothetical protein BDZ89DRAFT_1079189 [Hymenopellis radicata]|nr:hypothetical protein BDZ89DRAFT_1079189 [Hymenopellis radicata]